MPIRELRDAIDRRDRGFTLIELLVVVVIIGILIAIAIPLYLNYENGAKNKSTASDLRGAVSALELCFTDNGAYPSAISATASYTATGCSSAKIPASSGTTLKYYPSGTAYMLVGYQGTGANLWYCYNSSVAGSIKTETTAVATVYALC